MSSKFYEDNGHHLDLSLGSTNHLVLASYHRGFSVYSVFEDIEFLHF
jgi:hypothetical protein